MKLDVSYGGGNGGFFRAYKKVKNDIGGLRTQKIKNQTEIKSRRNRNMGSKKWNRLDN